MKMKSALKVFAKNKLRKVVGRTSKTPIGGYINELVVNDVMSRVVETSHNHLNFKFAVPNAINRYRVETFSTKEPETLEWIDSFQHGSIFWDVGANVGLYSIYAAKKNDCMVYAFEPSVFNLELLARNTYLNDLTDQICLVPLALSDQSARNKLNMTTTEWGGALSAFGVQFGWNGSPLGKVFEYQTLGVTMNDALRVLNLPQPDYIKIDVDGIEHLILRGGAKVIGGVRSILIELNDAFSEQMEEAEKLLRDAGFILNEKRQSEIVGQSLFSSTYNQIWVRL